MEGFEETLSTILSSPETMGQIMALANSISGRPAEDGGEAAEGEAPPKPRSDTGAENPLSLLDSIDPAMIGTIASLWGEYTRGNDEKTALLQAMKPFLSEERRAKLDKAVQIARISRVIRAALQQFKGAQDV